MENICQAPVFVRLVGELSIAALKSKEDKELSLWYALRSLNSWGSGVVDLEWAIKSLTAHYGYSKSTVYRLLTSGNGKFWGIQLAMGFMRHNRRSRIEIYGIKTVAEYLGICGMSHFVKVPISSFRTLQQRRAWLYASLFKPKGVIANPMCRQTIQEQTGLDKTQQRRYETTAGVRRTPNYAFFAVNEKRGTGHTPQKKLIYTPQKQLIVTRTKQYFVPKRLGNTYHSQAEPSSRGILKKVSSLLRERSLISDEAQFPRRYFRSLRKLIRDRKRQPDSHFLISSKKRLIKGRLEWCAAI